MTAHVGQKHKRQTRRENRQSLIKGYAAGAVGRHAKYALRQCNTHVKRCPDAPLAPLGEPAQKAQQHDHCKSQQGGSARKAAPVGGCVLRAAQHG